MCGIYCELCGEDRPAFIETDSKLKNLIKCRGPDSCKLFTKSIYANSSYRLSFFGSVLWMQGETLTPQPVISDSGVLLYNGDVFDDTWDKSISDTLQIMQKLDEKAGGSGSQRVFEVISGIKGPFSIVYYDNNTNILFFCRDKIGRNSLLFCQKNDSIIISSVLGRQYENTVEIPALHIFTLDLKDGSISSYCRSTHQLIETSSAESWLEQLRRQQSLSDHLFQCDDVASLVIGPEDKKLISEIENIAVYTKCKTETMKKLLKFSQIGDIVDQIIKLLKSSIKLRLEAQPFQCKNCVAINAKCHGHCTVGVLFSGGLDCSVIALLADRFLPPDQPIDLINVAFKGDGKGSFDVPDRLTGRNALAELKSLQPLREWRFIEVNVSEDELRREQHDTIADLVHPRCTVLDESLGSALWFAARASREDFTSSSRVLLLGSGADELFGGYTRHRSALKRGSWDALGRELALDWQRISNRNLARDNRVVGHHGRQPRLPYLDEDFAGYVLRLKPWFRCIPSASCDPGLGDKLILRLAACKLGLVRVSALPKRALQFGSRIANKKENGAHISERFKINS